MIAALYVEKDGVYFGRDGVDPWDVTRDARSYAGPHPVVAHPPCQRWGRFWAGGNFSKVRKRMGDDGGCFAHALATVRRFGGVLEHPEASHAWRQFGLLAPYRWGGWDPAGDWIGWTCCVEQGHYGHRMRKATWLYCARVRPPELIWGPSTARAYLTRPRAMQAAGVRLPAHMRVSTGREAEGTPKPFADLLISIARSAA